ncbi:MAG: YscO family type III secretion system apparatus protein [Endozoicomonadaceae bacterium]|nr:YscO family type III secretion system apparatus protein [Endozoicomonadaceae bacterium]
MLHDLLRIKKIREKSAHEAVKRCRYKVEQAVIDLQKKEKALEDYLQWRKAEEKRLYDEIMNTQVKERELDLLKRRVVIMREKDSVLEDDINKAKEHLTQCKKELEEAEQLYRKAMQTVEKFETFIEVLDEEAAQEAARAEEAELEEFTPRNRF